LQRRIDWYECTSVSEVFTASIIRAMSEAARGKSVGIEGRKSDKAELGRTCGRGRYQARAREPVGEEGGRHSRLARKRSMKERERIEETALGRATGGQPGEQRV
jgi:hypothetical protein